ncbi:MAG: ATP-binding protein [Victivallales bacterium]|nr:ATP-binding protein [Victivallales bacterium]
MIFKRKIYDEMLKWKREQNGKTALLIKGARRVGKTTVAREFAEKEYQSYVLLDFAHISKEINSLFDDLYDMDDFFMRLQLLTHVSLYEHKSVIILDEIQLNPKARQSIKYLVEDGRYDYIETGSLLSIKKNTAGILIPSEETRITMNPMDYEEFRWALGDSNTCDILRDSFLHHHSLGDSVNRRLMHDFRYYMLVGGMPQAVVSYLETHDFSRIDQVKRSILELYEDDFTKIDSTGTISRLFHGIPSELGKFASRYQISSVVNGRDSDDVASKIGDMVDSLTVNIAWHADDPNVGFALNRDSGRFKLYLADTGLFTTLAFWDKSFTENIIYEKLLSDKLATNLGFLYENIVSQMLKAKGDELYYYTFPVKQSNHLYEIDFLLSRENKICPIEVKSSGYRRHASLDAFYDKFSSRIKERYLIYTKDFRKDQDVVMLPVYMTMFL